VSDLLPSAGVQAVDVFIDLSSCPLPRGALQNVFDTWARPESLGTAARKVTCVIGEATRPDGRWRRDWTVVEPTSLRRALNTAMADASSAGVPLLLLIGAVDITSEALAVTCQSLGRDPMLGFAIPRIGCKDRCCFARLSRHGMGETEWLPRKILSDLPDRDILVEIAAPCVLIGPQVLGNFGFLSREFEGLAAALVHYMACARRCGFRTVLCNRAVVGVDTLGCDHATVQLLSTVSASDLKVLRQLIPDLERTWREFRPASWERFERLCTAIIDSPHRSRPSLLLDVRNVGAFYNGTVQAVLGLANALHALAPKWDVAVLAAPEGAAFHGLEGAYAPWRVYTAPPDDQSFTVTLRPSQPWHISEMIDLHRLALCNAYMLLDTINWDVAYSAPSHLEGTWQFLAEHADAFLFDSEFTHQRFAERFPRGADAPSLVTYFSFDPKDYVDDHALFSESEEDFILVIGNSLDHKDVSPTVDALASAFPFRRIKALGPATVSSPFVSAQRSGELPAHEVHRLYATARYVVCPSFYEGFGFPIVTALAYGRTVLARRSSLLEEIAARCGRRGRLVLFERREELVALLGKLVHGEGVPEYPLGLGLTNGQPETWRGVASNTLEFLESVARTSSRGRWIARDHAVRQVLAYRA